MRLGSVLHAAGDSSSVGEAPHPHQPQAPQSCEELNSFADLLKSPDATFYRPLSHTDLRFFGGGVHEYPSNIRLTEIFDIDSAFLRGTSIAVIPASYKEVTIFSFYERNFTRQYRPTLRFS